MCSRIAVIVILLNVLASLLLTMSGRVTERGEPHHAMVWLVLGLAVLGGSSSVSFWAGRRSMEKEVE